MTDPYAVLGVKPDDDDETIRKRYLELVRQYPPEQQPAKFADIRAAYERLKDLETRVRHRVFEQGRRDSIEEVTEEVTCRITRRRYNLQTLMTLQRTR